jgi:pyruvate formate-lyase/glycerol dehydratase family glycyl radical enzyme
MNARIKKLREGTFVERYPVCHEKAVLHTESYKKTEGEPQTIRVAKAFANALDNIPIFIEDGELIVGNTAAKPHGVELDYVAELWPEEVLETLNTQMYDVSKEYMEIAKSLNEYWRGKNYTYAQNHLFSEKAWPVLETGVLLWPRVQGNESQYFGTKSGSGMGMGTTELINPDFERVLNEGLIKIKEEAEQELRNTVITDHESLKKRYFLEAVIISHEAAIRFAGRFAELAKDMAAKEKNPVRKKELERIAENCAQVPAHPARGFYEAAQSLWFIFNLLSPNGTLALGRLDQYMYPFYKKDKEMGLITDEQALELLQCFRVKCTDLMSMNVVTSVVGKTGNLVWLNAVVGGQTPDGKDATNELTYLILEAARTCPTPHHTITVRVHEGTPEALMLKAIDVLKAGVAMPAFVGDKSYVKYLTSQGVHLEGARDFVILGCLEAGQAHASHVKSIGFVIGPAILELTLNNGVHERSGLQVGPRTGDAEKFKSFDDLWKAYKEQLVYFLKINEEYTHTEVLVSCEKDPQPFLSSLMDGRIKEGKDINGAPMPFSQEEIMCPIGLINTADSLAAIKKLVFEEKKVSMKELKAALEANWQDNGYSELRKVFLAAPKYGNDDNYVDLIARDLYSLFANTATACRNVFGNPTRTTGISAVAHWQAGVLTGALPDGRYAFEPLADGSTSPMRGRDFKGPTAVIKSASKIEHDLYQGTLMNMKFHPSALKSTEDSKKLSDFIKTYLVDMGGAHIQFNAVSKEQMLEAQKSPENHRDLIVRVAGYSAYFVTLDSRIQGEIIGRTEHQQCG